MPRIRPQTLALYRTAARDYGETRELIDRLRALRHTRRPMFLTLEEFKEIAHWKLDRQLGRVARHYRPLTDEVIRTITQAAFSLYHENERLELELRFGVLSAVPGVGMGVASAVLALVYPEDYAVIDFRGWRQLFGERKDKFNIGDYHRYLTETIDLAVRLGWYPQEVDLALWAYDQDHEPGPSLTPPQTQSGAIKLESDPLNQDWLRFNVLDGAPKADLLKRLETLGISLLQFKCQPIYHMNKRRNFWLREL
jgi:hypothetical protein